MTPVHMRQEDLRPIKIEVRTLNGAWITVDRTEIVFDALAMASGWTATVPEDRLRIVLQDGMVLC